MIEIFEAGGCPSCGCDIVGEPVRGGLWADSSPLECTGCGLLGAVTVDEDDGAYADMDETDDSAIICDKKEGTLA